MVIISGFHPLDVGSIPSTCYVKGVFMKRAIKESQKYEMIWKLYNLWLKQPQLRLGQLIYILSGDTDVFYIEDYDLIKE